MKKFVSMFVALLMAGSIAHADTSASPSASPTPFPYVIEEEVEILQRLQTILIDNGVRVCIAYDIETGVMYILSRSGGICAMVDAEGNPRLYTPKAQ